jgi:hypothetical protein
MRQQVGSDKASLSNKSPCNSKHVPCIVKGTAERGMRKEAAYTFIPQRAVTVAAPPRISIAVTITVETRVSEI